MTRSLSFLWMALVAIGAAPAWAWEVQAWPEFFRPGPFGKPVAVDWKGPGSPPPLARTADGAVKLTAARNGYVSFHLSIRHPAGGKFRIEAACETPGVEIDLFREWFHRRGAGKEYYPDALIPIQAGSDLTLPDADMKVPGQTAAAVFVDVWVPKTVKPGTHRGRIVVSAGGKRAVLRLRIEVLPVAIPDDDAITADHNSYGEYWMDRYYGRTMERMAQAGKAWSGSKEFFAAVHAFHRLLHEHRGMLHQLSYGHSGKVNPNFAPAVGGSGRTRRIVSWEKFDRHYGPLLDGSAFVGTRRGRRPLETMYLPINPNWPADYLAWGTPAYEVEFVNVVARMEKHFRQKGWTKTRFEMFFNHKTRFKVFDWDGDETRFPKDNAYFKTFGRLLAKAVPADSPVKFVFRHDASWLMRQQFDDLAGVVNFWICNKNIFSYYPEAPALLHARGDRVWIYGSPPNAFSPAVGAVAMPLRAWMLETDGFVHWLAVNVGDDPWFNFRGGGTGLIFPGEKFGLDELLSCARLKLQRNAMQDLAVLDGLTDRLGSKAVRDKVASFAGVKADDWWRPGVKIKKLPPWEWNNAALNDQPSKYNRIRNTLDGRWWLAVRAYALTAAGEVRR